MLKDQLEAKVEAGISSDQLVKDVSPRLVLYYSLYKIHVFFYLSSTMSITSILSPLHPRYYPSSFSSK
jgi:hypothetical protein